MANVKQEATEARNRSVGWGPRLPPPTSMGSSTSIVNAPASTEQCQPPRHRPVTLRRAATPPSVRVVAMVLVAMIVTGGPVAQNVRAAVDVVRRHDTALEQQRLERTEPAVVVAVLPGLVRPACHLGDQAGLEVLPGEQPLIGQCGRETEGAALPRLVEDQLAVRPGNLGDRAFQSADRLRAHETTSTSATPTMASRVTRAANSSSLSPWVCSGRRGRTKYLFSALESHTLMRMPAGSSSPISASSARGSRTARAR